MLMAVVMQGSIVHLGALFLYNPIECGMVQLVIRRAP